jgi:UDP-N-acetylglucosamine 2-epimerase (non-hydrolysing)
MPEEVNRLVVDRLSDELFAPSPDAVGHLLAEGVPEQSVHLVGNVMVDTLLASLDRARRRPTLADLGLVPGAYGLVTLHRPANVDDPAVLERLLGALERVAVQCPLLFPVHPRTQAALGDRLLPAGVRPLPPLGYLDCIALEADARIVLTDSGGMQEETTVLGVPCLTLREETERPVTVTEGTNEVVGRDPERIVAAATRALSRAPSPHRPDGWDGRAADRIADVLCRH